MANGITIDSDVRAVMEHIIQTLESEEITQTSQIKTLRENEIQMLTKEEENEELNISRRTSQRVRKNVEPYSSFETISFICTKFATSSRRVRQKWMKDDNWQKRKKKIIRQTISNIETNKPTQNSSKNSENSRPSVKNSSKQKKVNLKSYPPVYQATNTFFRYYASDNPLKFQDEFEIIEDENGGSVFRKVA